MSTSSANNGGGGGGTLKRSDSVQQLREMANTFTTKLAGFFHLNSINNGTMKDAAPGQQCEYVSTDPMASVGGSGITFLARSRSGSNNSASSGEDVTQDKTAASSRTSKTPDLKPKKSSKISSKIAKLRLPLMSGGGENKSATSLKSPTSPFPAPTYPCTSRLLSLQPSSSGRGAATTPSSSYIQTSGETTPVNNNNNASSVFSSLSSSSASSDSEMKEGHPKPRGRAMSERTGGVEDLLLLDGENNNIITARTEACKSRHGRISCAIGKAVAKIQQRHHHHNQNQQEAVSNTGTDSKTNKSKTKKKGISGEECETDVIVGVSSAAAFNGATTSEAAITRCCSCGSSSYSSAVANKQPPAHASRNNNSNSLFISSCSPCCRQLTGHHHLLALPYYSNPEKEDEDVEKVNHHHHQQHQKNVCLVCSTCCQNNREQLLTTCSLYYYGGGCAGVCAARRRRHSSLSGLEEQQAVVQQKQQTRTSSGAKSIKSKRRKDEDGEEGEGETSITTSSTSTFSNKQFNPIAEILSTSNCSCCQYSRTVARLLGRLDVLRRFWPAMERTVVTYDIELTGVPASLISGILNNNNNNNNPPSNSAVPASSVNYSANNSKPLPCLPGVPAYSKSAAQSQLFLSLLGYVKCPDTLPDELRITSTTSTSEANSPLISKISDKLFKGELLLEWLCSTIDRTHYLQYLVKNDLITLALQFCTDLLALGVIRPASGAVPPLSPSASVPGGSNNIVSPSGNNNNMTTATASPSSHATHADANCLGVTSPQLLFKPEMNYSWSTFLTNTARSFNGNNGFHSPDSESPTGKSGRFTQQDVEAIIQKLKAEFADRLELSEKEHATKTARLRNRYEAEMRMLELKMSEMSIRIAQLEAENGKLTGRCKQLEIEQIEKIDRQKHQSLPNCANNNKEEAGSLPDVVNPASSTSSGLDTTSTSSLVINLVNGNNRSVSPETSSISSLISSGSHSPQPTQPGLIMIGGQHSDSNSVPGNVSPISNIELQTSSTETPSTSATPIQTCSTETGATPLPSMSSTEPPADITPTVPPPPPLPTNASVPPPPPPCPGAPPPPPPPPPAAAIKKIPRKKAVKISVEMKPLFWRRIQFLASQPPKPNESSTLWFSLQEPFIDVKEIEKHFGRSSSSSTTSNRQVLNFGGNSQLQANVDGRSGTLKKLLDGRRSQAIGIAISSYRLTFDQIREILVNGRLTAVKLTLLETLDNHRPTVEEIDSLVEHVREFGEEGLDKPDLFCYRLTRIPRYDLRLNSLIVRLTLPDGLQSFEAKLSAFRLTCDRVRSSEQLRYLFGLVLAVGNVLNAGNTSRGQADGFQLDVVPKLKEIKSSDGSLTLLHYVVNEFITHLLKTVATGNIDRLPPDPELPTQPELAAAADVDLTSLRVDLDRLRGDLERCSRYLELIQVGDEHLQQGGSQGSQNQAPAQPPSVSSSLSVSPANNLPGHHQMMPTPPQSDGDSASSQGDISPPAASPQPPPVLPQQPNQTKLAVEDGFTIMLKNFIVQAQEDISQTEQLMEDAESKFTTLVAYFAVAGGCHDGPQVQPASTGGASGSSTSGSTSSGPSPAELFAPLAAFSCDVTAVYRRELARRRRLAVVAERRSQSVIFNSPQPSNQQTHPFFLQNHVNSAPPHNNNNTDRRPASSVKDRLLRQGRLA